MGHYLMKRKSIKVSGCYREIGQIQIGRNKIIQWESILGNQKPPSIPFGTRIVFDINFIDHDFLSGKDGVVWATYSLQQAEMIRDTLFIQLLPSFIEELILEDFLLYKIIMQDNTQTSQAIDFIWRSSEGLRLQPDWIYPLGKANDSFEKWMSEQ